MLLYVCVTIKNNVLIAVMNVAASKVFSYKFFFLLLINFILIDIYHVFRNSLFENIYVL